MKLHTGIGPNPRFVYMVMAEKGIKLPSQYVDLMGMENRKPPYTEKNVAGQLPCLELDNGDIIAEITVIGEYLEDKNPTPPLWGTTAEERAETRMWVRRVDLNICEPMANGFRYGEGLELFSPRMRVIPEAADGLKGCAQDKLAWLDGLMEGKQWICGDRFSAADIMLFATLDFFKDYGQPLNAEHKNIMAWFERVNARPSAAASVAAQTADCEAA